MLHGRDAKSQWFGLSAEWSFGGHKPIYFWECARERKWKAKATTTKTATAERILALYDACRAVLYWAIRKTVNGVFFFPSYFFSSSSFLGSEEFYLCNIAIWPIQKKKKKLAHTFGHTNICCLVHAHTCTLGCRILSPDSVKGDYGCAMRKKCNEIILFIIEIETKQWNEMDVLDWEWEFILSFRPKLKKNLNFWKNGFIAEKIVFF